MRPWFAILLLAGCSTAQWERPGASAEMVDADARACGAAAQAAPLLPSPQATMTSSGAVIVTERSDPVDANRQMQEGQRVQNCMRQKGYTLRAG
ncbi:MAG TPA: hypothetical protein VM183_02660 [Burkholderiales bacterium]|nr:hypothetical protein [Burkholderiales bacterium]